MKRLLVAVALLGALSAGAILVLKDRGASDTSFRFVTIARGDLEETVSATGTLSAVSTVQVGTQVSGQIAQLYADFNDHVKKGQLIARLDPTLLEQAVRLAEADVQRAQADVDQRSFELEQATVLYTDQAVTTSEYKTAQYNLTVARATLTSAQAGLERAQQNLQYTSIYAPIDGVVIERNVDVGQTVAASFSAPQLFLIAEDLAHMQILAQVDESDIGQIREGQPVRFTVQAYTGRTFTGVVRQVRMQSTTSENVVNYTVVVSVENDAGSLLPGMTATVSFEVAKATDVLQVANAALRLRPSAAMLAATAPTADSVPRRPAVAVRADSAPADLAALWYVADGGRLAVARVRTGLTDGQMTEIAGAEVHEGMQVIASASSATTTSTASNPFQSTRQESGPPRPPGGF
jgi:HlyD family secretion protein